jgi:hypothetical protein
VAHGVAAERVQRGGFHAVDGVCGLSVQPGLVYASGAAHDGIQQTGMQASGLVTGQIHHDGDGSVDPHPRRPPNMLIDTEGPYSLQSIRVARAGHWPLLRHPPVDTEPGWNAELEVVQRLGKRIVGGSTYALSVVEPSGTD